MTTVQSCTPFMDLYDAVDDGDVPVFDLEDEDLPGLHWVVTVIGEEQQVATVEGWLHASTAGNRHHFIMYIH